MQHCLSVIGFYAKQREITFAATKEDIDLLAKEIDFTGPSKAIPIYVPDDSPSPYDQFLKGIRLRSAPGPLQITVASDVLVITGSPRFRHQLATSMAPEKTQFEGAYIEDNLKIQYYPQHPFLASTSLALIVNVIGCGEDDADLPPAPEVQFNWIDIERRMLFDLPILRAPSVSAFDGGHLGRSR